jgi:hypothetical protein
LSISIPTLAAILGTAAGLAACGPDTVSAPTVSSPPGATPSATAAITGSPTPPPASASPAATPAAPVSTSGPVGQTLTLDPGTLPAGAAVHISGYAPDRCTGVTILSNAFPGPQEFAGVHAVTAASTPDGHFTATATIPSSTPPGGYPVTVRACGGNLGVQLTLRVTPPS